MLVARRLVGDEPFAVILSDDVVVADRPAIGQLIEAHEQTGASIVAVMEVDPAEADRYGIVDPAPRPAEEAGERLVKLRGLVEKPPPGSAPSSLAIVGRYVLTPATFDMLERTSRGAAGEVQLTDAIQRLMEEQDVYGYTLEGVRYDAGTTMGWIKATVELALLRPDVGPELRRYLATLDVHG